MRDPKLVCSVDCGAKCCRQRTDVYISSDEVARLKSIAAKRGHEFEAKTSMASPDHFFMELSGEKPCSFLEGTLCGIWQDRPDACRAFPLKKTPGCLLSGWQEKPKILLTAPRYRLEYDVWRDSWEGVANWLSQAGMLWGKFIAKGVRVDDNRNAIGHYFLRETDADFVLMLDDDMVFPSVVGEALAKHDKPIACGVYFQRGDNVYPHIYRLQGRRPDGWGEPALYFEHPQDFYHLYEPYLGQREHFDQPMYIEGMPLIQVDAAGTGCVLIRRDVLERTPYPWFRQEWGARGDLLFFVKAGLAGYKTWVDPGIICGHLKTEAVTLHSYLEAVNA